MSTLRSAAILKIIVDLIIENGPGWVLPAQDTLCSKLAISRTALREVMAVLEFINMVKPRPKVGTIVNPIDQWQSFNVNVATWKQRAKEAHAV